MYLHALITIESEKHVDSCPMLFYFSKLNYRYSCAFWINASAAVVVVCLSVGRVHLRLFNSQD